MAACHSLGQSALVAKQLSARGAELHCALRGDRVLIAGRTVEYLRGEITVDAQWLSSAPVRVGAAA